jgi:ribosomal protein S18 acetylase RimI-like enzyme
MMDIIYCAAGNKRYANIAIKHGMRYGAQLPNTVYHSPYFTDQNWKKPDKRRYMAALKQHRPALATVLDLEREEQLGEVLSWAIEAAYYVREAVIIIPKVMSIIPKLPRRIFGKQVRLGYSVPTKFAGTQVPIWEFSGWPIHLLGGSPYEQSKLERYLDVKSVDGNYAQKMANRYCQFYDGTGGSRWANNRYWPKLEESPFGHVDKDAPYFAFELSCINIMSSWRNAPCAIRFAVEEDIPAIKQIANNYKNELGYVMIPALKRAIIKNELWVATMGQQIVGFVNWYLRRDSWATVYEIAVLPERKRMGIGKALLDAIPYPIQLKCTIDNPANKFYEQIGMQFIERQNGRKRQLNLYRRQNSCRK